METDPNSLLCNILIFICFKFRIFFKKSVQLYYIRRECECLHVYIYFFHLIVDKCLHVNQKIKIIKTLKVKIPKKTNQNGKNKRRNCLDLRQQI